MKPILAIAALAFVLPGAALAATRTYDTGTFEGVSVAAGVEVHITLGSTRSVIAETRAENFDDLRISVGGNVLRIDRPDRNWFSGWFSGSRPSYQVRVVTPALRSLEASSGSEVAVEGSLAGDFSVTASSGSEVKVSLIKGGNVKAGASSGSEISITGSCISLQAEASSGSDLDAEDLKCENANVKASSGSEISIAATKLVAGTASSGADIRIRGKPSAVQVETSSGADVTVKELGHAVER